MRHLIIFTAFLAHYVCAAQVPINEKEKAALIDSISIQLQRNYVFPDKAKLIGDHLKKQLKSRAYAAVNDYVAFVRTLNQEIQSVHSDKHMGVEFDPEGVEDFRKWISGPPPTPEMQEAQRNRDRKANFGFVKVERLPGNIGYIDFRLFYPVNEESENTVAAAMNFIANSDAIIIDLRQNGGGHPRMVQLIISYFLDKPVHYNSLYNRPGDSTVHYYSLEQVKGKKMPHKDLYVLTSRSTFSGAEEFAYNIKNLKRGTLIGEVTGGGAHPTATYIINNQVLMRIPMARAINPFTKTNWEGTGVEPDILLSSDKALLKARQLALEKAQHTVQHPTEKADLEWALIKLNAELQPVTLNEKLKQEYAGVYQDRIISLENGELYYQRGDRPRRKLIALSEDLLEPEGLDFFRMKMVRNKEGKVEKILGLYSDGNRDESVRTSKTF